MNLTDRLERLLKAYSNYYDIDRDVTVDGGSFPATATYYLRDENYLINRRHILNVVENHEYVYFSLSEHLTADMLQRQLDLALRDGLARIKPSKIHMSSKVTLVVLSETMTPEAKRLLRKTRYRKNYRFAFYGWMELQTAAMECATHTFYSNPAGKKTRILLEDNFPNQ